MPAAFCSLVDFYLCRFLNTVLSVSLKMFLSGRSGNSKTVNSASSTNVYNSE